MRILKAYAEAGKTGNQGQSFLRSKPVEPGTVKKPVTAKPGGDSLSISAEARALLEGASPESIMSGPQDATYDQNGNVMRQFDELQNDLRRIASQVISYGDDSGLAARLGGVRNQLATLRAQV